MWRKAYCIAAGLVADLELHFVIPRPGSRREGEGQRPMDGSLVQANLFAKVLEPMVMRCGPVRRANFHSVNGSYARRERDHASWCGHSVHVKARGDTELHMGMEPLEEAVGGGIEPRSHGNGLIGRGEGGWGD